MQCAWLMELCIQMQTTSCVTMNTSNSASSLLVKYPDHRCIINMCYIRKPDTRACTWREGFLNDAHSNGWLYHHHRGTSACTWGCMLKTHLGMPECPPAQKTKSHPCLLASNGLIILVCKPIKGSRARHFSSTWYRTDNLLILEISISCVHWQKQRSCTSSIHMLWHFDLSLFHFCMHQTPKPCRCDVLGLAVLPQR